MRRPLRLVHVCLLSAIGGLAACGGEGDLPPVDPPPIDAADAPPDAEIDTPDAPMPSALVLSPNPVDFGDVVVARTSAPSTLTLRNTGIGPTGAVTLSITGNDGSDFNYGATACNDLAPEGECTITVTFSPGGDGARSASLRAIAANGGDSSALLHGIGVPDVPRLAISPTPWNFGDVATNQPSAPKVFTVENEGTAVSGELSISLANGDDGDFVIEAPQAGDCANGMTLAGSARCNVRVRFAPRSVGGFDVDLLVSATPGGNAIAALQGNGILPGAPILTLSPSTASFGTVGVGQASAPVLFTLTNSGQSSTSTISVLSSSQLFTIASNNCPQNLAPSTDCTFTATYTPLIAGGANNAASDIATITATAGSLVQTSNLSGTGSANLAVTVDAVGASGRVTSNPAGIDCTSGTCNGTFTRNTVTLQAIALASTGFAGWMGACLGELTTSCTVTMNAPRSATAVFVPLRRLTVTSTGGVVTSAPSGINCPTDCVQDYNHGTVVTLTAEPSSGYRFGSWSVASCGTATTCQVTMNAATSVTATYVRQYTLTVNARDLGVASSSSVTVRPSVGTPSTCTSATAAGAICSYVYDSGIDVVLERTLGTSTSFQGWTSDCSGTGACGPLVMNADHSVNATFASYRVVITLAGNGKVAIAPSSTLCPDDSCNPVFAGGTTVTLTPQASAGAAFWGWNAGNCTGSGPCQLLMDGNKTTTAEFRTARNLTVTKTGQGTVFSSPSGIDCNPGCTSQTAAFPDGRTVTLNALPAPGYVFNAWGGACQGQSACVVTMNAATTVTASFTPGTDLVVQAVACTPDPVAPGAAISCNVTVQNNGTTPSASFTNRLALSTDTTIDGNDAQLATCNLGSIGPGASAQVTCSGTIAAATVTGSYFAGVMADSTAAVPETDESNNTGSDAIVVTRPDITVSAVACTPEPASPGGAVSCNVTFANSGAAAGAFTYDLRLSADTTIDTTDALILNCSQAGGVPAVGTAQATCAGTLPHALGNYRVGVIADRGAAITETSETNNTGWSAIRIGTDLAISQLACSDAQSPGGDVTCSYRISNAGTAVGPFTTAIRLSVDGTITSGDALLGSCHTPSMAAGAVLDQSCTVTLPTTSTAMPHTLGVIVDAFDVVAEWDFSAAISNNLASEPFVIMTASGTDLVVSPPVCTPNLVAAGAAMSCVMTVTNQGPVAAPSSTVVLRHSGTAGGVIATSTVLTSCPVPALGAGAWTTVTCDATAPASTGTRYTSAWADSAAVVTETDEANNESAEMTFTMAAAGSDLDVIAMACPDPAGGGSTIVCDVTIQNRGTSSTVPFANRIVRSTDSTITTSDTPGADCNAPAGISAMSTLTLQCSLTLSGITSGTPYIGMVLDTGSNVSELDEANNTGYDQITVVGTGVDLVLDSAQTRCTADGILQGGQVACTVVISNRGTSSAAASRTGLAINSMPIGDCPTPSIPGLGSARVECLGTVPLGTAPGAINVAVTPDFALTVTETNETNNTLFRQIHVLQNSADLVAQGLTCWSVGSAATCLVTVGNNGGAATAPFRLSLRQSADAAVDANDPQVGSCNVAALGPVATAVHRCAFTLADPSVNIGVIVDADGAVAETIETNNLISAAGTWTFSNLTITNFSCSYSSANGGSATCNATVNNLGSAPAGPFDLTIRKSSNSTWEATDVFLATLNVPSLAAGASQAVTITAATTHSSSYMVGKVDELGTVPESNETDNTAYDTW